MECTIANLTCFASQGFPDKVDCNATTIGWIHDFQPYVSRDWTHKEATHLMGDYVILAADACRKQGGSGIAALAQSTWIKLGQYYYNPSFAFGIFAIAAFGLTTLIHLVQTGIDWKQNHRWFSIVFLGGGFLQIFGWAERVLAHNAVQNGSYFKAQLATLTISPIFFSAYIYAIQGLLLAREERSIIRWSGKRLAVTFIVIDFVTLLLQAAGGGLAASSDPTMSNIGQKIMLGGIILQLITMIALASLFLRYLAKSGAWARARGSIFSGSDAPFKQLILGMALCIFLVILRGVYRSVELARGFNSLVATTEAYLIGLDCIPMMLVMFVFNIVHAQRTLPGAMLYSGINSFSMAEVKA